ncbi:MAG: hypothetical protein IPI67_04000 [Myxococcales bacterium]|nr:hypothetical protein [Myxococcales bacterium]
MGLRFVSSLGFAAVVGLSAGCQCQSDADGAAPSSGGVSSSDAAWPDAAGAGGSSGATAAGGGSAGLADAATDGAAGAASDPLAALPTCVVSPAETFDPGQIQFPAAGSNGYVTPSPAARAALTSSVASLAAGDGAAALSQAGQAGYKLCRGAGEDAAIALYRPQSGGEGAAVFALRTGPARALVLEAPHPLFDSKTLTQAFEAFTELGARALVASGTHRCANSAFSSCAGTTTACSGGADEKFRTSDMAHVADSFYESAHEGLAAAFPSDLVIGVHGMADVGVSLSDGTSAPTAADAPVAVLAKLLGQKLAAAGLPAQTVTTCNGYPGAPSVVVRLCGETDVAGRFRNGSLTPCTLAAKSASGRFIHMEQSLAVRTQAVAVRAALGDLVPAP